MVIQSDEDDNWRPGPLFRQTVNLNYDVRLKLLHMKWYTLNNLLKAKWLMWSCKQNRWHGVHFDDEDKSYYDPTWEIEATDEKWSVLLGTKVWLCPTEMD